MAGRFARPRIPQRSDTLIATIRVKGGNIRLPDEIARAGQKVIYAVLAAYGLSPAIPSTRNGHERNALSRALAEERARTYNPKVGSSGGFKYATFVTRHAKEIYRAILTAPEKQLVRAEIWQWERAARLYPCEEESEEHASKTHRPSKRCPQCYGDLILTVLEGREKT